MNEHIVAYTSNIEGLYYALVPKLLTCELIVSHLDLGSRPTNAGFGGWKSTADPIFGRRKALEIVKTRQLLDGRTSRASDASRDPPAVPRTA